MVWKTTWGEYQSKAYPTNTVLSPIYVSACFIRSGKLAMEPC